MNKTITKYFFAFGTSFLMLALGLLYGATTVSAQMSTTTDSTTTTSIGISAP